MRTLLLFLLFGIASLARGEGLLVIAHPQVPDAALSLADLANIYLIKKTNWGNGQPVVPVNREASSEGREEFSDILFSKAPGELAEYWNRLRFQGKRPPVIQTSEAAVAAFVRNVPGAVGYVDAKSNPPGVKVLLRLP